MKTCRPAVIEHVAAFCAALIIAPLPAVTAGLICAAPPGVTLFLAGPIALGVLGVLTLLWRTGPSPLPRAWTRRASTRTPWRGPDA